MIKLIVFDLDNTIWNGTLAEQDNVALKDGFIELLNYLDLRGIVFSIASRNEFQLASQKLQEFGINEFFLFPQISWDDKGAAVRRILNRLNLRAEDTLFIDDQQYELREVRHSFPEIMVIEAPRDYLDFLKYLELDANISPTEESKTRRLLYKADLQRSEVEETFGGNNLEFLESLKQEVFLFRVSSKNMGRLSELSKRTNQLNTSGITYEPEELAVLASDRNYIVVGASMKDKFGSYGTIGLCVMKKERSANTIKLFLLSCRVMTRRVSNDILKTLFDLSKQNNSRLCVEFVMTGKNRAMYITYKMLGFYEVNSSTASKMLQIDDFPNQPLTSKIAIEQDLADEFV
jgi:FkbH-like protein